MTRPPPIAALLLAAACGSASPAPSALESYEPERAGEGATPNAPPPEPLESASGPGWRLNDGVFESAVLRLRVRSGGPWVFQEDRDEGQEFVLSTGDTALFATRLQVQSTPIDGQADTVWAGYADAMTPIDGTATFTFDGRSQAMRAFRAQNTEAFVAVITGDGGLWVVQALFFSGGAARARTQLAELPELASLSGGELRDLREQLLAQPQLRIAQNAQFARATFTNFAEGIRWPLPNNVFWRVRLSRGALIEAEDPERRLRFTLGHTRLESADGAGAHDALRAQLRCEAPEATSMSLGSLEGLMSECVDGEGLLQRRRRGVSAVRQGENGPEVVWWIAEAPPQAAIFDETLPALGAALSFGDAIASIQREGTQVIDRRLGVRFTIPDGFSFQALEPPTHGAYLLRAEGGDAASEIAVFAFANARMMLQHRARLVVELEERLGEPVADGNTFTWPGEARMDVADTGAFVLIVDLTGEDHAAFRASIESGFET
ncbi:MAG: hypothetical protein AAF938_11810 [Myxococcota bacterium]